MASQSAGRTARYTDLPDDNAIEIRLITRARTNAVSKGKEDIGTSVSWQKARALWWKRHQECLQDILKRRGAP
jgi:hypothetical protein